MLGRMWIKENTYALFTEMCIGARTVANNMVLLPKVKNRTII